MNTEGYLVQYHCDGDEVHSDLVDKPTYDAVCAAINAGDDGGACDALNAGNVLHRYFIQTMCTDDDCPWPYTDVKILGIACIWMF
jgi:hypothetical protein